MRGLVGRLAIAVVVMVALAALVVVGLRSRVDSQPTAAPTIAAPPVTTPPTRSVPPAPPSSSPACPAVSPAEFSGRFRNDGSEGLVEDAELPRAVPGPAFEFRVPGGGKRSEVEPLVPPDLEGDQLWVHDVSDFRGVPTDTDTWQLVLQWHQIAPYGSPPISLEVKRGRLVLDNVGAIRQDLGPIGPDDTLDVVLHIVFSTDPARATVEAWRGGVPVLAGYHPPAGTMLDGRDYLKVGLYRDPSISQSSTMLLRRLDTGPTAASIGGLTGTIC